MSLGKSRIAVYRGSVPIRANIASARTGCSARCVSTFDIRVSGVAKYLSRAVCSLGAQLSDILGDGRMITFRRTRKCCLLEMVICDGGGCESQMAAPVASSLELQLLAALITLHTSASTVTMA